MLWYIFGIAVCCFAVERLFPGWRLPAVRTWPVRVVLVNLVQLGIVLLAGAIYTACTALGEFFYHANVRTPQWIGYFFQRPEMHRIHHQHNRHRNNYGDIVWWDMLFGTYENPMEFVHTCGFDDPNEQRLLEMLMYKDVHK